MFNPLEVAAARFGDHLADQYANYFASRRSEYAGYIGGAARLVVERLGNCDALYHDVDHTIMVTLVGQQILRGRLLGEALTPDDWLHFICALLTHDIGYVRGVCPGDTPSAVVVNESGDTITPPRGASDAFLAPYHIDRAKIYVRERFARSDYVDAERIARGIEMTRFPVPEGGTARRHH